MIKISGFNRALLALTGLLAAYQIVVGVEGMGTLAMTSYTIAFGVLLIAGLLLIIQGYEALESPLVVIVSTIIPLGLSVGLVAEFLPDLSAATLVFAVVGLVSVAATRLAAGIGKLPVIALIVVHGVAGLIIFYLPLALSINGVTPPGFSLVGVGGGLIGLGGVMLSFLKTGVPILPRETILTVLPALLCLMTLAFVLGFAAVV